MAWITEDYMGMLTFWVVVTVVMSHLCSLLEVTLFSVRTSALFPDGHPNSPVYGHLKLPHLN